MPLSVKGVSCGSVRRDEEGIGIASDVVKVEGEDPGTPGFLRGNRARWSDPFREYVLLGQPFREPRDRDDSPISV